MRNILLVFALLITQTCLYAQSAAQWQQIYGGPGVEVGYGVKSCLDQGYIVVGSTSSFGPADGYIVRTDSLGLVMWSKTYGGTNVDIIRAVELLPDSGFIMTGYTNSFGNGGYDGWILRLDKNGDTLWTSTLGTVDWDFFYDVETTWDNGFVFAGGTYGAGMGDEDMLFVKMNSAGSLVWLRTYGGVKLDEARGVAELSDSNLVGCGFTYSLADTLGDSWILKINSVTGDTIWSRTAHFNGQPDKAYGISNCAPFNLIYFCGSRETSPGNEDPYVSMYLNNGDSLLSATFGGGNDETFHAIATRPEGTLAATGTNYTVGAGSGDMMMFHTEGPWSSSTYGTAELEEGFGIDITHDLGYIMCGSTQGFGAYQSNVYLVKTDSLGVSPIVLYVREPVGANGSGTSVFPNPAGESATITFDSRNPISGPLTIEITSVTGQSVMLISGSEWNQPAANNANTTIDVSSLPPGIYFYNVLMDDRIEARGNLIIAR